MTDYLVVWEINVDGDTPRDAALNALTIQRDRTSHATIFTVTPRCACGTFHEEAAELIDCDQGEANVHH